MTCSSRILAIAMLLPGMLAGCAALVPTSTVTTSGANASPADASDASGAFARVYTCPDGLRFSARTGADEARIDLGARRLTLARESADTAVRYTDGATLFQPSGSEATIVIDASIRSGCRSQEAADPWEAAALRGVDLRALGQEPGWSVELVEGEWLRVVQAGADGPLVVAEPARERTGSDAMVYTGQVEGQRVRLRVTESACSDSMSGESYPLTATLTLDGRQLRGCGRRLQPGGGSE